MAENGGEVWVGTPEGAYRIEGDAAVRIPDFKLDIRGISVIDGVVWLATTQGAYRVDGNTATRVPDKGLVVTSITKVGSQIWLATATGAYVVDGDTAKRVPDRDLDIAAIVPIDGKPWLATDLGAFELTPTANGGFSAAHVVNEDYDLNQILEIDGTPWLATDHGAFRVDPTGPKHIELISPADPTFKFTGKQAEVFRIIPAGGKIWFIARPGCYRVDGDVSHRMPDAYNMVATIVQGIGQDVWIATRTGAYRVRGDSVQRIPDQSLDVSGVTTIGGRVWIASATGAWVVDGDRATQVTTDKLSVSTITDAGGYPLLSTAQGAFVVGKDDRYYQVLTGGAVLGANVAGGDVWLTTPTGAFRVDTRDILTFRLIPHDTGFTSFVRSLIPHSLTLAGTYGMRVVSIDGETGAVRPMPGATVAYGQRGDFVDPSTARVDLRPGMTEVHAQIQFGDAPPIDAVVHVEVVPAWAVPVAYALVLWAVFSLVAFASAPFSEAAMRLVMKPGFRGAGSLWIVSTLLLTPPCRRYLLIRYRRGLEEALGPEPPGEGLDEMGKVGARLAEYRVVHVEAIPASEPFITACHVTGRALRHDPDLSRVVSSIPVPVLVAGDEVKDLGGLVLDLLADYGGLTDPKFARFLLDYGGFLLIVEGDTPSTLDSDAAKPLVKAFVDEYSRSNYVLVVTPPPQ